MFHRFSRTWMRFVAASLIVCSVLYFVSLRTTPDLHAQPVLEAFEKFLSFDAIGGSNHESSLSIEDFWINLQRAFHESKPRVQPLKPSRPHIEQSFNEAWPNIVHEDLIKIDAQDLVAVRGAHSKFVSQLVDLAPKLPFDYSTRGIVTTAGSKYLNALVVSLRVLRRVGSTLPVEVFFDARTETTNRVCEGMLKDLKASCSFFSDFWIATPDAAYLKSYQLKAFALLFSSFQSVLFLDADAFPTQDPEHFLWHKPFSKFGLVTWPDFWSTTTSPVFWQVAGVEPKVVLEEQDARASTESGILLVDKRKHAATLLLATYYNYYGPDCYYPLLSQGAQGEGDKETILHAAIVVGSKLYAVRAGVKVIGDFVDGKWESAGMKQAHPEWDYQHNSDRTANATKRTAFVHHNIVKLDPEKLFDHHPISTKGEAKGRRLWGTKGSTVNDFGEDLERIVWEEVVKVACDISEDLCGQAERRLNDVYTD